MTSIWYSSSTAARDSNPEKLYERLAEKTGSTVTVVPVVTEAQKQRVVAGKPI